jgi:hypothetical protein
MARAPNKTRRHMLGPQASCLPLVRYFITLTGSTLDVIAQPATYTSCTNPRPSAPSLTTHSKLPFNHSR